MIWAMKVVLLHDWLVGFRGGERVLEVFCELFPSAPLYTLLYQPGSASDIIEKRKIHTSFLDSIPGIYSNYRKFLPLFPAAAQSIKIKEDADIVISSSHCVIKGVKKPSGARHISYIHSPMRYLYDQYDYYFGADVPLYQRLGIKIFRNYLTQWDKSSNNNVDVMVVNSNFVKDRITRYYGLESQVVHPFVELDDFNSVIESPPNKEDYYMIVSAFAPYKRIDLAVSAFNKLKKPLKIIGSGQIEDKLKSMAGANIEFLGHITRQEMIDYLARAQALVFPGVEDFGITPLEALASGTPVIARKEGGVLDTLDNTVAEFFEQDSEESLMAAVKSFEGKNFDPKVLQARAKKFSKNEFREKILQLI